MTGANEESNKEVCIINLHYTNNGLIREFQIEGTRCQNYSYLLYKAILFTFVAEITLVVTAFQREELDKTTSYILMICIPCFVSVFGVLDAYNIYALEIFRSRAEKIHQKIYNFGEGMESD